MNDSRNVALNAAVGYRLFELMTGWFHENPEPDPMYDPCNWWAHLGHEPFILPHNE